MADMALESVGIMEGLRDDYVTGEMSQEEAFEYGFIDSYGTEQEGIQAAWDRDFIPTEENLNNALFRAEAGMDRATYEIYLSQSEDLGQTTIKDKIAWLQQERRKIILAEELNEAALENLKKERPTCNICYQMMQKRTGRFGDFYFCDTGCKDQPTVSDKYWQSVRIHKQKDKL